MTKTRSEIPASDQWDLSSLYPSPEAWEADFKTYQDRIPGLKIYQGRLGESLETLAQALDYSTQLDLLEEKLFDYAQLKVSEDLTQDSSQDRMGRLMGVATQKASVESYFRPELLQIPEAVLTPWLQSPRLQDYRISLEKTLRYRPHTLGLEAENLLALGAEAFQTPSKAFSNLTNSDLDFGQIDTPEGPQPLTQSTFSLFLQNPDPAIREKAYRQFYRQFQGHAQTLGALYAGSIHQDVFQARARNFPSALERALFPDKVPVQVYKQLIASVRSGLPRLQEYYALKARHLGQKTLNHWDVYAPLVQEVQLTTPYDQACSFILEALKPLGSEYTQTLAAGLTGGWVDRYENKGKRSGAFSSGSYSGWPYILMNYKDTDLRDVFTLAHEAGHSMHSHYSAKNNPFPHYGYTIFEAEVASTFNEQLLGHHLLQAHQDPSLRAYILGKMVDDTVATLFRQTMFAEFELLVHEAAESGQALTVDFFRKTYRTLLETYFGPQVHLPEEADLEGLRIPHFYRAFYVYKYATGISAAITLAQGVLTGGEAQRQAYFQFLKSGGSRYPAESLALAGVDVQGPQVIEKAIATFGDRLKDLSDLLDKNS